ncbi:MAG: putative hydroxymethylpyrimidine transporter CytX [Chloroflexi bacterium]|nr:putative hydroxymethylpyrimidine transporter CytX [Chloroflexota bacterium]
MLKLKAPPEWGIEPVPNKHRILGFLDYFALWTSLGVGLLVLLAGTFLVPGLSLGQALLAIVVGTAIGNLLLALAGVVGSDCAIPTMVMLRPVLGIRGSYLPTFLNILQLIGWGAFEIIIMAQAANTISQALLGFSNYFLWALFFAGWCTLLAIGGPLVVVRQWLEKFAVWLVYAITIYLTYYLFSHYDIGALLRQPGTGELPFWLAVDLVVAMPISWMPLVADYNRFARHTSQAFWGTYLGYFLANVWFYGLGALFILTLKTADLIPAIMAVTGGWVVLLLILVDETDNCFADIYSAAVSGQNILSKAKQWWLAVGVGVTCFALAATVPLAQYEGFLLFIGSVFSPLFGILAADYFVLRKRRYEVNELYRPKGLYWYNQGVNWRAVLAWALGILIYQVIARWVPWLGASVPSFLAASVLHLAFGGIRQQVREQISG